MYEKQRLDAESDLVYQENIRKIEEKSGTLVTGVIYGEDGGEGNICIKCGGFMSYKDNVLTCKECGRIGIYL